MVDPVVVRLAAILIALGPCATLWGQPTAALEAQEELAFKQAAALVGPAVVRIETVGGLDVVGGLNAGSTTTGVVVAADGYLVSSAFHFASKPASILVTLPDGRRFPAKLIAVDRQRMMTLLKIDATNLPVAVPAPRTSFRVGQWALALGRTFESDQPSVSVGIVSALDRVWGKAVQTDAKVSPVNYGGPLVDLEGRVIGVLAPLSPQAQGETAGAEWYDSGIGFAVPLEDILAVLDRLKQGKDLLPGLMGVNFKGRDSVGSEPVIDRVRFGAPAETAGLKKGDRITAVEGRPIQYVAQFRHVIGRKYAGDDVRLSIRRDDQDRDVTVTLTEKLLPFDPGFLGILPRRPVTAGLVVRAVLPETAAAKAGLQAGDRIVGWQDQPVTNAASLQDFLSRTRPDDSATITIERAGQREQVAVTLTAVPHDVPASLAAEVPTAAVPAQGANLPEAIGAADGAPMKVRPKGRSTQTLAAHERDYWLFVPENAWAEQPLTLMVFLHPKGDNLEAPLLKAWRGECDRRGIAILAPQCDRPQGWGPTDVEFILDCLAAVSEQYPIAPERIWIHGYQSSATMSAFVGVRQRAKFRGIAIAGSALAGAVAENEPEARLQWYFAAVGDSEVTDGMRKIVDALRTGKYPTAFRPEVTAPGGYLPDAVVEELARWADSLDRL